MLLNCLFHMSLSTCSSNPDLQSIIWAHLALFYCRVLAFALSTTWNALPCYAHEFLYLIVLCLKVVAPPPPYSLSYNVVYFLYIFIIPNWDYHVFLHIYLLIVYNKCVVDCWDLSSPTRDQTCSPCSGNSRVLTLGYQRSPCLCICLLNLQAHPSTIRG